MQFDEYQQECLRTGRANPNMRERLACHGLGIAGEAGECADHIKKHLFHGHALDREHVKKEIGDVLWYASALADACGLKLSEIAQSNIDKLRARYPNGFSKEASIARVDTNRLPWPRPQKVGGAIPEPRGKNA